MAYNGNRLRWMYRTQLQHAVDNACLRFQHCLTAGYARTSTLLGNPRTPRYEDVAAAMLLVSGAYLALTKRAEVRDQWTAPRHVVGR